MLKNMIRFEILFPINFNDGTVIPSSVKHRTILEMQEHFGAASVEQGFILGYWTANEKDRVYIDKNYRVFVDVIAEELFRATEWFSLKKPMWLVSFQQEEIWLVFYPLIRISNL